MSIRRLDGPSLAIGALCLVLPTRRKEWGEAARSELATLTSASDRRSFSLSSLRIVVADRATLQNVCAATLVTAMLLVAVVSTADISDVAARLVGILVVAALAGLFLLAGRAGAPGQPIGWISTVGAGRAHRAVRMVAHLGSSALVLTLLLRSRTTVGLGPGTGTGRDTGPVELAIVGVVALAMAAGLLAVTAERAAISSRAVGIGGACGVLTGLGWFGFVLAAGYVDPEILGQAALIAVLGSFGVAAIVTAAGRPASEGLQAGLSAGVVAVLLIFTAPMATYTLVPATVPDPSPGSYSPQLNQYAHDEQDAVEAEDPYVLSFLVGGLLSIALIGSAQGRRRTTHNGQVSPSNVDIALRPLR